MRVADVCSRQVYLARADQPLVEAAREMRTRHVGALVVIHAASAPQRPIGILTDRDIVCGQLTRRADLQCLTVADVMSGDPLTLPENLGISEAIDALARRGVRRAPVVGNGGGLVGIVSFDDLSRAVAAELTNFAKLLGVQPRHEGRL